MTDRIILREFAQQLEFTITTRNPGESVEEFPEGVGKGRGQSPQLLCLRHHEDGQRESASQQFFFRI